MERTASAGPSAQKNLNENGGYEIPTLLEGKKSDRQPMPLLKRQNATTEMVRTACSIGTVCGGRAGNTTLWSSKAATSCAHREKPQGAEGKGARC